MEIIDASVLILCGGRGRRLQALSTQIPKALVRINDRPILSYILDHFQKQNFSHFVFGTGHLSEQIEEFVAGRSPGMEYVISNAGVEASMLERIVKAKPYLSDDVVVCYGDTFLDIDYRALLSTHRQNGTAVTMVTSQIQNPFGIVNVNGDGFVSTFVEKPIYDYYIGCFVFNKAFFEYVDEKMISEPDGRGLVDLFIKLASEREIKAHKHNGLNITFNTAQELVTAQKVLNDYFTLSEREWKP